MIRDQQREEWFNTMCGCSMTVLVGWAQVGREEFERAVDCIEFQRALGCELDHQELEEALYRNRPLVIWERRYAAK